MRGAPGKIAQAADRLHHPRCRRHGRHHRKSDEIAQARKATIELLLGNHPLDCPVCDAGGECELQDMTFKYGAARNAFVETKQHRDEQQWSPVVFFDRPRCILCYRCVRICGEGMDVWALGMQNAACSTVIAPNEQTQARLRTVRHVHRHLPRGALTSAHTAIRHGRGR